MDRRHLSPPFGVPDTLSVAASDPLTRRELEAVCRMLEHERPETSASIAVLVEERLRLAAGPDLAPGLARQFDGRLIDVSRLLGYLGSDEGCTVGYGRLAADARWPELAEKAEAAGYVSVSVAPIRGERGGLLGVCMLHHHAPADPVDEDRLATAHAAGVAGPILERACRRCEQELLRDWVELALESASAGLWDWDVPSGRIRASRGLRTLLGMADEPQSLGFDRIIDAIDPRERPEFLARLNEQLLSPGGRIDVICRLAAVDGTRRWIRSTGRVVARDIDDRPIRVIGQHLDETRRHELEEHKRLAAERLHRISASAPVMLFQLTVHDDGTVALPFVSEAVAVMTGVSAEAILAEPRTLLERVHPDDLAGLRASLDRSRDRLAEWRSEFRLRAAGDGYRWVHGHACPRRGTDGSVTWHGFLNDVTAQKRFEDRLIESREIASEANRLKSAFMGSLGHELRTPLTAILGFVDLLHDGSLGDDAEQIEDAFETIRRNGRSLLGLIDEMQELAEFAGRRGSSGDGSGGVAGGGSGGGAGSEPVPVDPRQLLEQVIDAHRTQAAMKGLQVDLLHESPVPPMIVTDPFRLHQALDRLIENAVRFTDAGRVTIRLSVAVAPRSGGATAGSRLAIVIEDTGRGMTQERIDAALIGRSARDDVDAAEQLGLGLRITRSLVHAMGAELRIASKPGHGTAATILVDLDPVSGVHASASHRKPHEDRRAG